MIVPLPLLLSYRGLLGFWSHESRRQDNMVPPILVVSCLIVSASFTTDHQRIICYQHKTNNQQRCSLLPEYSYATTSVNMTAAATDVERSQWMRRRRQQQRAVVHRSTSCLLRTCTAAVVLVCVVFCVGFFRETGETQFFFNLYRDVNDSSSSSSSISTTISKTPNDITLNSSSSLLRDLPNNNHTGTTTSSSISRPAAVEKSSSSSSSSNSSSSSSSITRWNSTELQDWVVKKDPKLWNKAVVIKEVMEFAPKPKGTDVELYNMDAWHRLRALLLPGLEQQQHHQQQEEQSTSSSNSSFNNNNNNNKVLLCSNGGSSTAGGGNIYQWNRFDEVFVAMIRATADDEKLLSGQKHDIPRSNIITTPADLSVVNRGHGRRGSAHSGFLMHSFIPAATDIIIWEFAINDVEAGSCQDINSALVIWLDQVARHASPPPLVILGYFWDRSFKHKEGWTAGKVFRCHERIAATYNFVVGSVNLASYIKHLDWDYWSVKKFFLADLHHPNELGHLLLSFLLWDLVLDDERLPITSSSSSNTAGISETTTTTTTTTPPLPGTQWAWCNQTSPMDERLLHLSSEKRSSFASWTSILPRNDDNDDDASSMLSPQIVSRRSNINAANASKLSTIMYGKAVSYRQDRQISVVLPCCATGERLDFNLSSPASSSSSSSSSENAGGKWLSAFQMLFPGFENQPDQLRQNLLIELLDSKGEVINPVGNSSNSNNHNSLPDDEDAEESFLVVATNTSGTGTGCWQGLEKGPWFVFPPKESFLVSRISFCNRCITAPGKSTPSFLSLEYLALF